MTARSSRARRAKRISATEAGNITALPDGRFQIDCRDSGGNRHRPTFKTEAEAKAALDLISAQKASGEFIATAATATFNDILDLLLKRNEREGLEPASQDRAKSVVRSLRPVFGAHKLIEFPMQHMRFVKEYLEVEAKQYGKSAQTLAHTLSAIKIAFDEAIEARLIAPPNPVTAFNVRVPRINVHEERDVLRLDEITALVGAAVRKFDTEHESTFRARFLLILLGLLAGLRNQECSGLHWDCVDFDGRMIYVRRVWRKGKGIVPTTKTKKGGFRGIPMSPILFAALSVYAERMESLGYQLDGPVLRTKQVPIVTPQEISSFHWPTVASKAGFMDQDGELKHQFYALRHTAANLWRAIGIQPDRLQKLMGHYRYDTTADNYLHETPEYVVLAREAEPLFSDPRLGLERTTEGYIDALGLVLARRWKEAGIEISCAPPRSKTPQVAHAGLLALPGNTIDLVAVETVSAPGGPAIKSEHELRLWQIAECKRLSLAGRTINQIAAEFRLSTVTVNRYLRIANVSKLQRGKLPEEARQNLMEQMRRIFEAKPNISVTEVSTALNVSPTRVTYYARRLGKTVPHQGRGGGHKIGDHEERIRQMYADGKSYEQMAAIVGCSPQGVAYFCHKRGMDKPKRLGGGLRIEHYDAQIRELIAAGRSQEEITRELGVASHSGIIGYIKRLGLQTQPGNRGKRIVRRPKSPETTNI